MDEYIKLSNCLLLPILGSLKFFFIFFSSPSCFRSVSLSLSHCLAHTHFTPLFLIYSSFYTLNLGYHQHYYSLLVISCWLTLLQLVCCILMNQKSRNGKSNGKKIWHIYQPLVCMVAWVFVFVCVNECVCV